MLIYATAVKEQRDVEGTVEKLFQRESRHRARARASITDRALHGFILFTFTKPIPLCALLNINEPRGD